MKLVKTWKNILPRYSWHQCCMIIIQKNLNQFTNINYKGHASLDITSYLILCFFNAYFQRENRFISTCSNEKDEPIVEGGGHIQTDKLYPQSDISLYYLAESVIMMYHYCTHKAFVRVALSKELFNNSLDKVLSVSQRCKEPNVCPLALDRLKKTLVVLREDCSKHLISQTWYKALLLTPAKVKRLIRLLSLITDTLTEMSVDGIVLATVPEYHIDTMSELAIGLVDTFQTSECVLKKHFQLYKKVATFMCLHFLDERIRVAECRDTMMQTIASFITKPETLELVHKLPAEVRHSMVMNLIKPYDDRQWGQNNWILVRIWKGSGFAYRYINSPHLQTKIIPKPAHADAGRQHICESWYRII